MIVVLLLEVQIAIDERLEKQKRIYNGESTLTTLGDLSRTFTPGTKIKITKDEGAK